MLQGEADTTVWVGDWTPLPSQQRLTVLGRLLPPAVPAPSHDGSLCLLAWRSTSADVAIISDSHFHVNCSRRDALRCVRESASGVLHIRPACLPSAAPRTRHRPRLPGSGARVGRNIALAATNIDVPVHDARRIGVVCNGRAQLAVDATLVSPVTRNGRPHDGADNYAGLAVGNAARRKRRQAYPELDRNLNRRCASSFSGSSRLLARALAASEQNAQAAWVLRWSISVAAQRALAATSSELPRQSELGAAGPLLALHELLANARWQEAPQPSCLFARVRA